MRAVFPAAIFLAPAFVFASALLGAARFFADFGLRAFWTGFAFLRATVFVCFFLVFFFGAIRAVYHWTKIECAAGLRAVW